MVSTSSKALSRFVALVAVLARIGKRLEVGIVVDNLETAEAYQGLIIGLVHRVSLAVVVKKGDLLMPNVRISSAFSRNT